MGRARLEAELSGQGIAETVAQRAIHGALRNLDEETLARRVLASARRPGRRLTPQQAMRLLRQRGFEEETVERIMGRHIEDKDSAS
jgi:SOS response regulatory protein OraA/RecX